MLCDMSLFETKVASEFDLCDEVDQEIIEQSKIYGAKTTASVRIDPNTGKISGLKWITNS
jgi:hypothetical protein